MAQKIRVVEVKRTLTDILQLSLEEVGALLKEFVKTTTLRINNIQCLYGFINLASEAYWASTHTPVLNAPPDVALRLLLYNASIIPIIGNSKEGLRVRPGIRKKAVTLDGKIIGIAAEDEINVFGVLIDSKSFDIAEKRSSSIIPIVQPLDITIRMGVYLTYDFPIRALQKSEFVNPIVASLKDIGIPLKNAKLPKIIEVFDPSLRTIIFGNIDKDIYNLSLQYIFIDEYLHGGANAWLVQFFTTHKVQPIFKKEIPDDIASWVISGPNNCIIWASEHKNLQYAEGLQFLLNMLAKIYPLIVNSESLRFCLNPLYDLFRVGAMGAFRDVLTDGRESKSAAAFLHSAKIQQEEYKTYERIREQIATSVTQARQYMIIVEDKLGNAQSEPIHHNLQLAGTIDDPNAVLAEIKKRGGKHSVELVTTEYENRRKEWEMQISNKCPHVKLALKLRTTASIDESLTILHALSKYYKVSNRKKTKRPQKQDWIFCVNCEFRVICPHIDELIQLQAKNASFDDIRTSLMWYAMDAGVRSTDDEYGYFCIICSERLSEFITEDRNADVLGSMGGIEDSLRKLIWTEAIKISSRIRFGVLTDPQLFANTATDICHPLLLKAEAGLIRKGSRSARRLIEDEDAIDARTHLYAVIFIYAYILNLIRCSNTQTKNEISIGFEGVQPNSKISKYVDGLLNDLVRVYSGVIAQIEDITNEFITNRFREAYSMMVIDNGDQKLTMQDGAKSLLTEVVALDPTFHYAASAARVFGILSLGPINSPKAAKLEFETVMGRTLPNVLNAKPPKNVIFSSGQSIVDVSHGAHPKFVYKNPLGNLYIQMFGSKLDHYPTENNDFNKLGKKLTELPGVFDSIGTWWGGGKPWHMRGNDIGIDPKLLKYDMSLFAASFRLFVEYSITVADATTWKEFQDRFQKLHLNETAYSEIRSLNAQPAFYSMLPSNAITRQHKTSVLPITSLYDEKGFRHKWNIYVYKMNNETREMTLTELLKMYKSSDNIPLAGYELDSLRCSVCNILQSETGKLDTEIATNSLHARIEFDSFFSYYETRCPIGGLHDFKSSECIKCKLKIKSDNLRAYYDKYYSQYESDRQSVNIDKGTSTIVEKITLKTEKIIIDWQYDYSFIVQAAKFLNSSEINAERTRITPAIIEAIGATEGRDYKEIRDGINVPDLPFSRDDPRILAVDSTVRIFLSEYNMLRYYSRIMHPPFYITELLKTAGVPPSERENLSKLLPNLYDDYHSTFKNLLSPVNERPPSDALQYSIEFLCRMTLQLSKISDGPEWLQKLGNLFAQYELNAILRSEKLLSKPGPFNFMIFGNDTIAGNDDTAEDDIDAYGSPGADGEDVINEIDDDEVIDPFSLEGIDITDIENLEPA
jgi:hypothetical protein